MSRRGFALLAVLWVVVALGALAAGAAAGAGGGVSAVSDRIALIKGRWAAEGCLAAARAGLESRLVQGADLALEHEDTVAFGNGARCAAQTYEPGARLNPDSVGSAVVARLDSVLALSGETTAVARTALLTSDGDGRVNLNAAPPEVLAALPGLGPEAVRVLREAQAWHRPLPDVAALLARLSPPAREELLAHYAELVPLVSFRITSLVVSARGWVQGQRPVALVEEVVVAAGARAAVVRRRLW